MPQPFPLPGRFQISINGQLISTRFGTLGEALDAAPQPTPAHFVEIMDGWTRRIIRRDRG